MTDVAFGCDLRPGCALAKIAAEKMVSPIPAMDTEINLRRRVRPTVEAWKYFRVRRAVYEKIDSICTGDPVWSPPAESGRFFLAPFGGASAGTVQFVWLIPSAIAAGGHIGPPVRPDGLFTDSYARGTRYFPRSGLCGAPVYGLRLDLCGPLSTTARIMKFIGCAGVKAGP